MIPGVFAAQAAGGGSGETLWTPANLATPPKIWADWSSPIVDASGFASEWGNKGSLGGSFTQSVTTMRPEILSGDAGGKRALRFDGSNDHMFITSPSVGGIFRDVDVGWSFFLARKRAADTSATRVVIYAPGATGASRYFIGVGGTSPNQNRSSISTRRLDDHSTTNTFGPLTPINEWFMRRTTANWGLNQATDYVDGSPNMSGTFAASAGRTSDTSAAGDRLDIAADGRILPPSAPGDIDLAVVIIGSGSEPSLTEWQKIEGWAAWQCGLQDNLPASHPYKDAPPYV